MTYERPTIADFGPANALRSPMRSAYERLRTPYDPPYDHTPHTPHGLRAPFGGAAPMIGGQEEGQGAVGRKHQNGEVFWAVPTNAHVILCQVVRALFPEANSGSCGGQVTFTGNRERP